MFLFEADSIKLAKLPIGIVRLLNKECACCTDRINLFSIFEDIDVIGYEPTFWQRVHFRVEYLLWFLDRPTYAELENMWDHGRIRSFLWEVTLFNINPIIIIIIVIFLALVGVAEPYACEVWV